MAGITGRQIRDDSVEGKDIKDGSIELVDLAPDLVARLGQIDLNYRNILINSAEIRALKQQDLDQDLSIFVDSFDDDSNIDPASFNFEVDSFNGYVSLIQGGNLFVKDSTQANFDQGSFINAESFLDVGGDGAIRKSKALDGATVDLPNFPTGLLVTLDGDAVPISTAFGTYIEGVEGSAATVNFANPTITQQIYEIPITVSVFGFRYLELFYLKNSNADSDLRYRLELEDSIARTHTFPQRSFINAPTFQKIREDLNDASVNIDLSNLTAIRVIIENVAIDQTILSLGPQSGNNHMEVREDRTVKQTFILTEDTTAQILKLRLRWENSRPDAPLDVAIANVFETTLGTGIVLQDEVSTSWTDIYVTLDTPVALKKNVTYSVLIQSPGTGASAWDVARTANDAFPQFQNFYDGSDRAYSTVVDIIKPPISETIYFDKLSVSQVSTYFANNEFTSRPINLGLVPSSVDTISWVQADGNDTINVRVRFATTQSGLTSAPWSSFYTDPAGENITGVTPAQWFQYQVVWSGGTADQTTIVKEVELAFTTPAGQGNAVVISRAEFTQNDPSRFMLIWEVTEGGGTANFFISRDGKATWQAVPPSSEGVFTDFTGPAGNQIHARAILTGDARLFSWAIGTNEEFI